MSDETYEDAPEQMRVRLEKVARLNGISRDRPGWLRERLAR